METKQTAKQFVLFVGEGDFSYSASYVENFRFENEKVFATCLNSGALNAKQNKNIQIIKDNGGSVLTDVDATELESHPVLNQLTFSKIIFNFPHVPKKMNIGQNRKLVELFLKSAEHILEINGRIYVPLCKGQGGTDAEIEKREWCNSWQIVELASRAGLMLCDILPFDKDSFESYECTGFRGQSKSFHTEAAVTHVFCRGQMVSSASYSAQSISKSSLEEWFKSDCTELYECMSEKCDSPFARIAAAMTDEFKSEFQSIFVKNFIISNCSSSPTNTPTEPPKLKNSIVCNEVLQELVSIFLNNTKIPSDVTTIVSCASCDCNIDISRTQLSHFVSYFSMNEELLMGGLETVFSVLLESDCIDENPNFSTWSSIGNYFDAVIDTETPNCDEIIIKDIHSVYANYSVKKSNCRLFYTDIEFHVSNDIISEKSLKLGDIIKFSHNKDQYFAAILNLELISRLKFHVMDHRIFIDKNSYFTTAMFKDKPLTMYRSPSLFPASHTHDTSFWVVGEFEEKWLFLLVRRTVESLIKSVELVDIYYDKTTERESRCYRFIYQSHGEVLPKSVASSIHSQLRLTIEMSLNVCLR